jgi:hypothetical protein
VIIAVDLDRLADAARLEAERHPARSRERRAAAHLWVSLTVPPASSITAVRRAIASYGTPETQSDALELLGRLARPTDVLPGNPVPEAAPTERRNPA